LVAAHVALRDRTYRHGVRRNLSVLLLVALTLALAGAASARMTAASGAASRPRSTARQRPRARSKAGTVRPDPSALAQQRLTAAVVPLIRQDDGSVAVAVDDLVTGAEAASAGAQQFVTASIVKVDILATLLYQLQQAGQTVSADQQELATTMIENSDNDSASDLYDEVGGSAGIGAANQAFGLIETTVGTGGYWGLTSTTANDQIQLLRQVFTTPSVLWTSSQDYIQGLMSNVETDQQWGVPAAADPGTQFMVKNGWLPNPSLWEINSIGEIVRDHQDVLIAVLSDDNASEASGIAVVQAVAIAAAQAVAGS
jgi:Beta-lactamase enzyme family